MPACPNSTSGRRILVFDFRVESGQSKIENVRLTVSIHQNIARLQISMMTPCPVP